MKKLGLLMVLMFTLFSSLALAETTPPVVTITSPTSAATWTTLGTVVTLQGSASDNVAVTSVRWFNDTTGATGYCTGLTLWVAADIALNMGLNNIQVKAYDASGNIGSDAIGVRRTQPKAAQADWNAITTIAAPLGIGTVARATVQLGVLSTGSNVTTLMLTSAASQTAPLISARSSAGSNRLLLDAAGNLTIPGILYAAGEVPTGGSGLAAVYNSTRSVAAPKIWCAEGSVVSGRATVYPTTTGAPGGTAIFAHIYAINATAVTDTSVFSEYVFTSIKSVAVDRRTVIVNAGTLLDDAADATKVYILILGD